MALIFEEPPPHGYGASREPTAWKGKVVSEAVTVTVEGKLDAKNP